MSNNFLSILGTLFLLCGLYSSAQNKQEREHRIKKSQFPSEALQVIQENNQNFKRLKFYKTLDNTSKIFTAKFKKSRLFYDMYFNEKSELKSLSFSIKPVDIPEESFTKIESYLTSFFSKYKIRRLQQQYQITASESVEKTIKNAFQNMMIPEMNYEFFVKGTKEGTRDDYEIIFDSNGALIQIKKALPANYDRVLY